MINYTSYLKNIHATNAIQRTLQDVFDEIRSDSLRPLTQTVRNSKTAPEKASTKAKLPQFLPCVELNTRTKLNEDSWPTGIVQFDIDINDNTGIDMGKLREEFNENEHVVYVFTSPSGGLKVGINTDFGRPSDESIDVTKQRFRKAYQICLKKFQSKIAFEADNSAANIRQGCYLSHDPNAYYNPEASILTIDHLCSAPDAQTTEYVAPVSNEYIRNLVSYIDRDLAYHDRLPINCAVFRYVGRAGIPMMLAHWSKGDKAELRKQLEDQFKHAKFGNLGTLVKAACDNGYGDTGPHTLSKLFAKKTETALPALLTYHDAEQKVRTVIDRFFQNHKSTFLNVSTGFGKTDAVLRTISQLPSFTKVLYLVQSHDLAREIQEKYESIVDERKPQSPFEKRAPKSVHLKGRDALCENETAKLKFKNSKVPMPTSFCMNACTFRDQCSYIDQFDGMASVRFMTHNELVNLEGRWTNGTDAVGAPSHATYRPDYIIVDENWLKESDEIADTNTPYSSVKDIVVHTLQHGSLSEAVRCHASEVDEDFERMRSRKGVSSDVTDIDAYISEFQKQQHDAPRCGFLSVFHDFIKSGFDESILDHILVEDERRLKLNGYKAVADRYRDIPKLFLDATANERVVKSLLPDIEFHSVKVRMNDEINIYQLENRPWSRSQLATMDACDRFASSIREKVAGYKRIGLITYKWTKAHAEFAKWLAHEIGAEVYAHFGNLRGTNDFEELDCVVIAGRQMLSTGVLSDRAIAVFGHKHDPSNPYMDVPVRMKHGCVYSLHNRTFVDESVQSIFEHFSRSENVQAVGRARLIHGSPKSVFVFSNESLGPDVEITDFFRYDPPEFASEIGAVRSSQGCIEDKPSALKEFFSEHHVKKNRDRIRAGFKEAGFLHGTFDVYDPKQRRYHQKTFIFEQASHVEKCLEARGLELVQIELEAA